MALPFLLYKLTDLLLTRHATTKETAVIVLNILIFIALIRQLLKLNQVKYIEVTDKYVKYRQDFPWASIINWENIKQIQFGYSSVRFVTNRNKKFRFSLSKTSSDDRLKLSDSFHILSKKYDVELLLPM
ncbi:MAG: hypothetical protein ABUT20_47025 [Bacteroidota bacterium]